MYRIYSQINEGKIEEVDVFDDYEQALEALDI